MKDVNEMVVLVVRHFTDGILVLFGAFTIVTTEGMKDRKGIV